MSVKLDKTVTTQRKNSYLYLVKSIKILLR